MTPVGGGRFLVRLTAASPLPVRDAPAELAVDGRVVGAARSEADGRTLTLVTGDARVAGATTVEPAWNGIVPGRPGSGRAASPAVATPVASGPVLGQDPATSATYLVQRADYDLGDTAVRLAGLGRRAVEMRAAVYLPAGAPGPRPVVVFLHGRHTACYGDGDGSGGPWPCGPGEKAVPSYLGYGQAANALAKAGYVVVSISADGINALDDGEADLGAAARGQLVLAHLDALKAWNAGRGPGAQAATLKNRLDLTDVGLMGHSRGGEGVVEAALINARRGAPFGIRAVMPLAPVDFGRATLPGVPMAVVLPYCDGDVSDQQGQHFYDDSRGAAGDDVLRTSLLVMGADHNFFNSEWTPGSSAAPSSDDWSADDDPSCGARAPGRLTAAEQRAVGAAYIAGFFRLHLGAERRFLPLFDGSGGRAASAGRAVVYTQAQQPASSRVDLAPLRSASPTVTTTPGVGYCAGVETAATGGTTPCGADQDSVLLPHWTPAYLAPDVPTSPVLRMTWTPAAPRQSTTVRVAPGAVGVAQSLTFRAAPAGGARTDLTVTLADTAGRRASVSALQLGSALVPLPALTGLTATAGPKIWLRTVRTPLSAFTGVDLGHLATVAFTSAGPVGDVFLSDVAVDTTSPGTGGPVRLPTVSVGDVEVTVGAQSTRVGVPVTLDRPSNLPVTAQLDTGGGGAVGAVPAQWVSVTIPPGQTAARGTFVVPGSSDQLPSRSPVSLSVPTNALAGDTIAYVTVSPAAVR